MSNLTDVKTIKDILSRHGFHFSKSLGQNFLINPSVCPKMAEQCIQNPQTGVLEIGAGIGVLTAELAKRAKKVIAFEIDKKLMPVLSETLKDFDNIKIINKDFLKADLKKLVDSEFHGMSIAVCANLPYYITSPVIMKLLESRLPFSSITVMVQKEAADRICAMPGTRKAGAISVAVRYYSVPKILFKVSKGSFMPSPKVDSAVVKLDVLSQPSVSVKDEKKFFALVRAAFGQRRKTLQNSISAGLLMSKEDVAAALSRAGIPDKARIEQLNMEDIARLCDQL